MTDNRNYGLDIARIIATKIRNYKRDFSVFDRKILVYYMLYSTYSLAEYSYAAEPPVQFRLSHLSRRSEPL